MTSLLIGLDVALCILIVAAALDYLRAVHFIDCPVESVAFYLVAIAAFGMLVSVLAGHVPSVWTVMMHLGVTVYAGSHYQQIFERDWRWNGEERRQVR